MSSLISVSVFFEMDSLARIEIFSLYSVKVWLDYLNPISFDWSKLIAKTTDESFGIMSDVIFQIVEKMGTKQKLQCMP